MLDFQKLCIGELIKKGHALNTLPSRRLLCCNVREMFWNYVLRRMLRVFSLRKNRDELLEKDFAHSCRSVTGGSREKLTGRGASPEIL